MPDLSKTTVQLFPRNRTFNASVEITAAQFLATNSRRAKLIIQNTHASQTIEIVQDLSSIFGSGIQIIAGATYIDDAQTCNTGALFLVASGAATTVRIREEYHDLG